MSLFLHVRRLHPRPQAARRPLDLGHLATLIPADERRAPIVTVQDPASHSPRRGALVLGAVDAWHERAGVATSCYLARRRAEAVAAALA